MYVDIRIPKFWACVDLLLNQAGRRGSGHGDEVTPYTVWQNQLTLLMPSTMLGRGCLNGNLAESHWKRVRKVSIGT